MQSCRSYVKPNEKTNYIHIDSNHDLSIIKQLSDNNDPILKS